MPLVGGVARIYRGSPAVDRGELMQEGVVGLLRALGRYDLEQGTPFWAYASWWVRQAMQQLVAERSARGLEEPVRGEEGLGCTFGDLLADPQAEAAFERVPHHLEVEQMHRLLRGLSER